jgi:AcrR family transcriptional regulator
MATAATDSPRGSPGRPGTGLTGMRGVVGDDGPMEAKARTVRKDVLRNRALLLESADAVIREHGMDLSLNAVAHHAGVGVGTVYRHFPDREALIDALFEQRVDRVFEIMSAHVKDVDPVAGLRAAVFDVCRMQATDRGIWEVASAGRGESHREIVRTRLLPTTRKLVRRANATGRLRIKIDPNDLPVMLWAGGALHAYLGAVSSTAWWRYVQLLFDSFLADDDPARTPIEAAAPTIEEIDAAMRGWLPG